ncbi:shikimate kinase [Alkalibacillus haloalkaliphilus]|uniref:Shikimate kinase n=1 Tax=Alkalibacillus haloalkaliphilus TaxID=94136 RepID=A0A511W634_9BACI|nr:shikimate kinase [Alkalibacillus haloalkaliphilus]GEN46556.1 shikimate kinase [Alkalibacillus haloalkaliphilus]
MTTIALIGFMGSGKTTIGQRLARSMEIPFVDTDDEIVNRVGMSVPEIFDHFGEQYFRSVESEILKSLSKKKCVVATGGGIIKLDTNRQMLRSDDFLTVWLDLTFDTVMKRIANDESRPLWNQDVEKRMSLFNSRQALYDDSSHFSVNVDGQPVEELIEEIKRYIYSYTMFGTKRQSDENR